MPSTQSNIDARRSAILLSLVGGGSKSGATARPAATPPPPPSAAVAAAPAMPMPMPTQSAFAATPPVASSWALPETGVNPLDALNSQPPARPAAATTAATQAPAPALPRSFVGGGVGGAAKPKVALGDLMQMLGAPKSD